MDADLNIKVARLEVTVDAMKADVADIKADQKAQNVKLDMLVAAENQRKGAKAVTRILLGIVTSGGFLGWIWEHFHK